jgi:hypothetical protein
MAPRILDLANAGGYMNRFVVRNENEEIVAIFSDFDEAWMHLQIDLEGLGDIVEKSDEVDC